MSTRERTQKAVSTRINRQTLEDLDDYCERTGEPRNRIINKAIETWLELDRINDNFRLQRLIGSDDKRAFCDEVLRYRRDRLPDFLNWPAMKK